jgi:hypothetical protein
LAVGRNPTDNLGERTGREVTEHKIPTKKDRDLIA